MGSSSRRSAPQPRGGQAASTIGAPRPGAFNPGTSGTLAAGGPVSDWTQAQINAGGRMEAPVALPGMPMGMGQNFVTPPAVSSGGGGGYGGGWQTPLSTRPQDQAANAFLNRGAGAADPGRQFLAKMFYGFGNKHGPGGARSGR